MRCLLPALLLCLVTTAPADPLLAKAAELENRLHARIGLAIDDTGSQRQWRYHADDRFALVSTFKLFACAALLAQAGEGGIDPEQQVTVHSQDLLAYAPEMAGKVNQAVSLNALCAATLRSSDNTAANLLLAQLGGPPGVTAMLRALGDPVTRLDRNEPDVNSAIPGDVRDTTTPAASLASLRAVTLGDGLPPADRAQLIAWLRDNRVAGSLLRAGLPEGWVVADRTGAGGHGARGILAVFWPPRRAPWVVSIYIGDTQATLAERDAAIAELGRVLAALAT